LARKAHHRAATTTPDVLRARVERARAEGRFQTALELARQLDRDESSPANRALVRDCYLGRARQLRAEGRSRDALTVLEVAARLEDSPRAWLEEVAAEMAICGGSGPALALLQRLGPGQPGEAPDPAAQRVRGHAADAAVRDPGANRPLLPEALRAELDAVLEAFRRMEAGDDDGARAAVQAVGLRSPFLEWRVLLRGLQAYYLGDDARALENWQRLDPARLPARLAAPFRFRLDAGFRAAQPAEVQASLQRRADALQGSPLLPRLRELRAAMENKSSLAAAFRQAELLLPTLRQQAPQVVPRLAACLYWAVTGTGPEDVTRYRRVFGTPAADPNLNRLHALAHEKNGNDEEAHRYWGLYEKDVAAHPDSWPQGQADRARALVWLHMGRSAARPRPEPPPDSFPFYWDAPEPVRLRPSALQCFRRATELAPDLLEPHDALFRHLLDEGKADKAETVGRELLERFPDHGPTLRGLAELCLRGGETAEALALLQRALHANPLDRDLRDRVAAVHLDLARLQARLGRLDQARQEAASAETLLGRATPVTLCLRAALEFKAGQTARADELLAQVAASEPGPLVAYATLVEAALVKLPPAVKSRFDREFKAALAGPPDAHTATRLLALSNTLARNGITYFGQKTHAKKIREFAERAETADMPEETAVALAAALREAGAARAFRRLARAGGGKFPASPFFPFFEAISFLDEGRGRVQAWRVRPLLDEAERRARALPADERVRALLEEVEEQKRELARRDPFGAAMERIIEQQFGDEYADEDDFEG
jgi:tetratricopeptide (TPR) repeat protein